mgnify:FL=1
MLTIDRLAKIDRIVLLTRAAIYRGLEQVGDHIEARLVDAAYKVAEAKAAAIGKAAAKISDLEDARAELVAHGAEAQAVLREKYKAALEALDKELKAKGDKLDSDLAAAAEAMVAADKAYEATVKAASDKLHIEVDA